MVVFVNHKAYELNEKSTLIDLLLHMQLPDKGIALAINNKVIPKSEWSQFELNTESKVTMIRATQGG